MKVVILAGGYGTRISEESHLRPKPMVEIGGKPILWHIMKSYAAYGLHEFIICCGYKGHIIKDYFLNYYMYQNNIIKYMKEDSLEVPGQIREPWKVTLVNTENPLVCGWRGIYDDLWRRSLRRKYRQPPSVSSQPREDCNDYGDKAGGTIWSALY